MRRYGRYRIRQTKNERMTKPRDAHLWDIVKKRCTPLGEPLPTDSMGRLYLSLERDSLDLHHLTVQQAHDRSAEFIDCAHDAGKGSIEIITGRSGDIRREFETWAQLHPRVRSIEPLNGGGAFRIKLR
jgi:dsDNA-specific endonuclease/ATPase MutS2